MKSTDGLVCVRVESTIPLFPVGSRAAFGYGTLSKREAVAKALKYGFVEGWRQAFRKVKSRRMERELLERRWVVSVYGRRVDDGQPVWALATFDLPYADFILVRQELTFSVSGALHKDLGPWLGPLLPYVANGLEVPTGEVPGELQKLYSPLAGLSPHAAITPLLPVWVNQDNVDKTASRLPSEFVDRCRAVFAQHVRTEQQPASVRRNEAGEKDGRPGAILIGAGNYARVIVIPLLKKLGIRLRCIADLDPLIAQRCKEEYGFDRATTDACDGLRDSAVSIACICSYHHTHAELAQAFLEAGKKVFIEKPPVVSLDQLESLRDCAAKHPNHWAIGYNRRYAADVVQLRKALEGRKRPVTVTCIVQEPELPDWHWYNWPVEGGRTVSNMCHWIDLGCDLIRGCLPEQITCTPAVKGCDENTSVTVRFSDSSVLNLALSTRGDPTLGMTEYIDVRCGDLTATIDDFREARIVRNGKTLYRRSGRRDRAHSAAYVDALRRFMKNEPQPFGVDDLWRSSALMLIIREMHLQAEDARSARNLFTDGLRPVFAWESETERDPEVVWH